MLGLVLLAGCGGSQPAPPAIGFLNRTAHTGSQLLNLWQQAQQNLSRQIDLNPLQRALSNAPAQLLPGDSRVWNVFPHQLVVAPQADVSSAQFYSATGGYRPDPTGLIVCPQPCNVRYAPAYSLYTQPASRYAASWESSEENFDFLVQYEFENQILHALGYDTRWR